MSKIIFFIGHIIIKPHVLYYYLLLKNNEKKKKDNLIKNTKNNVKKYCDKQFKVYGSSVFIKPLSKNDIIKIHKLRKFKNFKIGKTGGSTGEPLTYYMSNTHHNIGIALLYRGWEYGGYKLGDKVAVLAGGSLVNRNKSLKEFINNKIHNFCKYSSYGMNENLMNKYYLKMKKTKPKFLRGYVTAIVTFAEYIIKNNKELNFSAVFTTAEMLSSEQRHIISKAFNCSVYNNYGLNDGGVSAYECKEHNGFHIDLERAYLEVLNDENNQVYEEVGRIVATSFMNGKATPFIKYETGDLGKITNDDCPCGSPYPLLKELNGRSTDALMLNGRFVGSPVLTVLMSNINVERYQFIQKTNNTLILLLKKSLLCETDVDEKFIFRSLKDNLGNIDIKISYVTSDEEFVRTNAGKHKIIINEIK